MSGVVVSSGQLLLNSGSAATPSIGWTGHTNYGLYLGNGLSHSYNGTLSGDFPGSGIAMRTLAVFGSQSNPFSTIGNSTHRFIECWASAGIINTSHSDFKEDIQPLTYTQVPEGVLFRWKDNPDRLYAGFLADSLPKEAFAWDKDGKIDKKAVEHTAVIGILCDTVNKLQKQIADLEYKIEVVKEVRGLR